MSATSHMLNFARIALFAGAFVFMAFVAAGARAATYEAGPAELGRILPKLAPGDQVLLAPGSYDLLLMERDFGGVTLKSADPSNPARFPAFKIFGGRGITIEDVVFDYTYARGDNKNRTGVSEIKWGHDITLRRILFDGDVARNTGNTGAGFGASFGLTLREAENVLIEDSEFHQWFRGIVVSHSRGFTLRGTEFHAMRSDGADFAAVENVLIEDNYFHDFQRHADSKDHPDMIQFWTNSTNTPSRNITIRNNVLNAANGAWTQSIFMRNEMVDSKGAGPEMFYRNISITGNVIINGHLHGITVGETKGLHIANNTLLRNMRARFAAGKDALHTPTIRIAKTARDVTVTRNIVSKVVGQEDQPDWRVDANMGVQYSNRAKPGHYDDVFLAALDGDPAALMSFAYLPEGPAGRGQIGAPALRLTDQNRAQALLVRATRDPRFVSDFTLDAGLTLGVSGADILWRFSDGAQATGQIVQHRFAQPGDYMVTAQAPGRVPARLILTVPDPQVLSLGKDGLRFHKKGAIRQIEEAPLVRLSGGGMALPVGEGREVFKLHAGYVAGFFGAGDMALDLRLRAANTQNPAGEILRIHNNIILTMTPQGQIRAWLNTAETAKPVSIATGPLRLHDGQWHDIGVRYEAHSGRLSILVNGVEQARTQANGKLRAMESWGISFGNPFGKKSFDGQIADFDLRSNTAGFASP